jgi:gibberellin A4 carboxyl methyltransferase
MGAEDQKGQHDPNEKSNGEFIMPATTGMKGAGYYDQNSGAQLSVIQALQDWVDEAVTNLPLPAPNKPVTVLDLGSSEGRNAVRLMASVVAGLRRRTDQPLQTIYSDLASNDFNQLFVNLQQARRAGTLAGSVYSGAVGGSFYGPLLPPGTVCLATSFNAIHWLDRLPAIPLPDGVAYRRPHPPRPGLSVSPKVTSAFKRQAEQGLIRFLECRARELVPSWSRGASCCWPARAIPTRPAFGTGPMTSSTTPVSTWSLPAGWNERSMNA